MTNTTSRNYETAATPHDVVRIYSGYLNAGDVAGLMTMYDEDATFSPEPGTLARGTEEIRELITTMTDPPPAVEGVVTWVQQVGDYALILHDYTITADGPDSRPLEIKGRSADVVHRGVDGAWRFFIDCVWAGNG
ncbi:hypothetical protein CH260_15755 [Rhodococcus sp. 05-2256-B2]|uniref:YybH family protein n=1 Tax=Nocardiaceae TaxID=85025 RepID=UPI00050CBDC0|nr:MULTISPECIES: nuclear transport factor 2 family protein [Rhodococcus]MBY4383758.1 nuclear transport factor 2 family protein [Rhodococcus fascians]MBY4399649.1 nuclear transport factor 2 family protein [Rhodococcus fascians]MBY4409455.1 nuclear transport factor 2 family protein [Rhodococcus fascians]MBY4424218.1 nuclear transport factor 2 family protein [Rhodococcus fascians]MBY4462930.1 nuclear transport factor 2 family protein [Rhodococcus fascians]